MLRRAASVLVEPAFWLSATISATMFSGNWGDMGVPIPLDRVCFVLTFATIVLRIPLGARFRLRLQAVHVAMALALAYAIGSAVVSGTITGHTGSFALLDRFGLVPFLSFMVAPLAFRTARERRILLVVLTLTGAYLGLTALFETVHANALVVPKYILNPNVGIHAGRARGPFAESAANGMAMWVCAVAATILAAQLRSRALRYACLIVALLCVAGILFTLTRGVWLAAAVGGAGTLAVYRPLRRYLLPVALAGAAVAAIALVTVPGLDNSVQRRTATTITIWDRYNLNNAAINMAEAHPLFGVGWDEFGPNAGHYYQLAKDRPLVTSTVVHNLLLSNLAELGLFGVTLWVGALVLGLGGALVRPIPAELRRWRYGLLAVVIEWVIAGFFGPLAYAFANTSLWVWAGLVYGRSACPLVLAGDERAAPAHGAPEWLTEGGGTART